MPISYHQCYDMLELPYGADWETAKGECRWSTLYTTQQKHRETAFLPATACCTWPGNANAVNAWLA